MAAHRLPAANAGALPKWGSRLAFPWLPRGGNWRNAEAPVKLFREGITGLAEALRALPQVGQGADNFLGDVFRNGPVRVIGDDVGGHPEHIPAFAVVQTPLAV